MAKIKLICTGCGVAIAVDDNASACRCPKCRTVIRLTPPTQKKQETSGESADMSLAYADGMLEGGNFEGALKAYHKACKKFPDDYRCWWGVVRSATKNFTTTSGDDCRTEYTVAFRLAPAQVAKAMKTTYDAYAAQRVGSARQQEQKREAEERERAKRAEEEARAQEEKRAREQAEQRAKADEAARMEHAKQVNYLRNLRAAKLKELGEVTEQIDQLDRQNSSTGTHIVLQKYPTGWLVGLLVFLGISIAIVVMIALKSWYVWLLWIFLAISIFLMVSMLINYVTELRFNKRMNKIRAVRDESYATKREQLSEEATRIRADVDTIEEKLAAVKRNTVNA